LGKVTVVAASARGSLTVTYGAELHTVPPLPRLQLIISLLRLTSGAEDAGVESLSVHLH